MFAPSREAPKTSALRFDPGRSPQLGLLIAELARATGGTHQGGDVDHVPTQRGIGAPPGKDALRRGIIADQVG
ncbi:MAG: hypothetical protein ACRDRM_13120 [Pseudonocardiaceae bacterium]